MLRFTIGSTLILLALPPLASGVEISAEDFESGFVDGEPLRNHDDWFFEEQNADPTSGKDVGLGGSWGVAPGDRAFTWTAKPIQWGDPNLVSVTMGGDWQTDSDGRLDDDRAGWSISDQDDSSDNIFGVQIDPMGTATQSGGGVTILGFNVGGGRASAPKLNIEAYWDGDTFGDDGCRTSIVELPTLTPNTWYRLRARFTKLTPTSCRIDVTFVQLDEDGKPTGIVHKGTIEDTAAMAGTEGNAKPNTAYFTASTTWPVYKNYRVVEGGFDHAYFALERKEGSTP